MAKKVKNAVVETILTLATMPALAQAEILDEILDESVNGNTVDHSATPPHEKKEFTKLAHLFGHRKRGCQARFHKEYLELVKEVMTSWMADRATLHAEVEKIARSNQALAGTMFQRKRMLAEETGKTILRTVFNRWRDELNRIVGELGGHPQEDGNVVFPDGSIAKMPRGLYIEPEYLAKFE